MSVNAATNVFPIAKVTTRCACTALISPTNSFTVSIANIQPSLQKYTVGSVGIWERIRRFLAVDPNRSTGVPLNPQYRNPPPGTNDPLAYDDPVSVPAGDIADNPYWKRDVRRGYSNPSVVGQSDVVGLLTIGSEANPSPKLLRGEEGSKQLVAVQGEGEKGLSAFFEQQKGVGSVLGADGMPPMPVSVGPDQKEKKYDLTESSYADKSVILSTAH